MRLSCRSVASLCLGAAAAGAGPGGITSAFIVQPVSLRQRQPASLSGGQRQQQRQQQHAAPFAQSGVRQEHSTSVTTIVMTAPVNTNLNNSDANSKQPRLFSARRGAIFRATRSLLSRGRQFVSTKRISRGEQEATAAALSSGEGQGGISKSRVGRGGRGWVRRTAASAAAAIVLRVALSPLSASAVPPMRGMGRRNTQSQVFIVLSCTAVLYCTDYCDSPDCNVSSRAYLLSTSVSRHECSTSLASLRTDVSSHSNILSTQTNWAVIRISS